MDVVSIIVSILKYAAIGFGYLGFLGEFLVNHFSGMVQWTFKHPAYKTESHDIPAFELGFWRHFFHLAEAMQAHGGKRSSNDFVLDVEFFERIVGNILGFLHFAFVECVNIDDDDRVRRQERFHFLECGGIHCHENVAGVSRGNNIFSSMNLESGNTS